jgi:hypothetical protein
MLLERFPHRPPVLRGRFHHNFLNLALDQPVSQTMQVERRCAGLLAFEAEVAVDFNVGHHDRQHLLVDVNSCDPVGHRLLLGERRACLVTSLRVASYRGPLKVPTTLNHSVNHARSGSNSCSASLAPWLIPTSPLPGRHSALPPIFIAFRGLKAQLQPVAEIVQCGEPTLLDL